MKWDESQIDKSTAMRFVGEFKQICRRYETDGESETGYVNFGVRKKVTRCIRCEHRSIDLYDFLQVGTNLNTD